MVPTPLHSPHSPRLLVTLFSVLSQHVPNITRKLRGSNGDPTILHTYAKRASSADPHSVEFILFASLIPVLVLLSGVFAGLTLGYMSLDETQLNVLSMSGTPSVSHLLRQTILISDRYTVNRGVMLIGLNPSARTGTFSWSPSCWQT
jgi:hypothetical protein